MIKWKYPSRTCNYFYIKCGSFCLVFDQKFYFYQWMEWWHFNSAFDINYLICGLVPLAPGCPIKCRTKISLNLIKQNDHSPLRKCCKSVFLVFEDEMTKFLLKKRCVLWHLQFRLRKGETVGLLAFSSRKLLIMWLFKHGKISFNTVHCNDLCH